MFVRIQPLHMTALQTLKNLYFRSVSIPQRIGRVDISTARELASLESERRTLELRIKRTRERVLAAAYQGN